MMQVESVGAPFTNPHIMLVDDHPIVRRGVREILQDAFPGASVREVSFGSDAILLVLTEPRWDMIILDLTLPDGSGIDVLSRIREVNPRLPVLILSMHSADQFARRALGAGASGYLTKDAAYTELVAAVSSVARGCTYVGKAAEPRLGVPPRQTNAPHAKLSPREHFVMVAVARGKTVREIAQELAVTVKTVSTFRTRALRKLSMRSNAEITRYAIEHGLLE